MFDPKTSSASTFLCPTKTIPIIPQPEVVNPPHDGDQVQNELHRWPTPNEVMTQNVLDTEK